jgi:hypothetical protein
MMPKKSEPEDILSEVEKPEPSAPESVPPPSLPPSGNGKLRLIIIVLSVVATVLLFVIAGLFFYNRFIAVDSEDIYSDFMMEESERVMPSSPDTSMDEEGVMGGDEGIVEEPEEAPPVVEPTPPPPDIPDPTEVEPVERTDSDNDGLRDEDERLAGTDPRIADTDGDGLLDGNEVTIGTDPLVADSDADGLTDGDEVNIWLSDPTMADTDGDGYEDGSEVQNGYNPNGEGRLPE